MLVDLAVAIDQDLAGLRMDDRRRQPATDHARLQLGQHLAVIGAVQPQPLFGAAVVDHDNRVLRHIDQTAGQVARVGRSQRRVGQTLATAVGRHKVFQHRQAFAEVRLDRQLDDSGRSGRTSGRAYRPSGSAG